MTIETEIIQFSAIAGLSKKDRKQIARAAIPGPIPRRDRASAAGSR